MANTSPDNASSLRFTIRSLIVVTVFVSIYFSLRTNFVYLGESNISEVKESKEAYSMVLQRASAMPHIMAMLACLYWLFSNTQIRPTPEETIGQGLMWGGLPSFLTAIALMFEFSLPHFSTTPLINFVFFEIHLFGIAIVCGLIIGLMSAVVKVVIDRFRLPRPNRSHDQYGTHFLCIAAGLLRASFYYPWGWILWWPAFSIACVSMAYFIGSAEPLGKRNGSRQLLNSLFLFPYLLFARIVWILQVLISTEAPYDFVNDSLVVARRLGAKEYPEGVTLICDLTAEFCDPWAIRRSDAYYPAPILDGGALMPYELTFLVRELAIQPGGRLLIHCANGHGRTGMVAAAWLIGYGYAQNVEEALAQLKKVRPKIHLNTLQRRTVEIATSQLQKISQQS